MSGYDWHGPGASPPNAQELMMFADGELDPGRAAQVAAFLQRQPDARARLAHTNYAARLLAGGMIERAHAGGSDAIADAVMASIEQGAPVAALGPRRGRAGRSAWAVRVTLAATVSLAVAAACALWARSWLRHRGAGPLALEAGATLGANAPSGEMSAMGARIKIDAVDFGARAGSIFYVKKGDKTETPVLWLQDDDAGASSGGDR